MCEKNVTDSQNKKKNHRTKTTKNKLIHITIIMQNNKYEIKRLHKYVHKNVTRNYFEHDYSMNKRDRSHEYTIATPASGRDYTLPFMSESVLFRSGTYFL